ncbi:NACHT, LRR and PYD domains-containing protein 12 [Labeo rohita]|uniref:NACHT, LRR and PYD domains-containing protein 12 n=1 Tax=Labeo rohita TaxID=84645 RepID=A0ABQ8L2E0_LABRO|nr:NACHT, LRR and PYD domains-containing protein 12 [Labeo rohita]
MHRDRALNLRDRHITPGCPAVKSGAEGRRPAETSASSSDSPSDAVADLSTSCCIGVISLLSPVKVYLQSCGNLSSVLKSPNSILRELDLSNNGLQDHGVKFLSEGLKSPNSKLCCGNLSSVLQSSNSVLRELDLSNNDLQDSGVMLLSEGLKSPNCQLEILLSGCMVTEKGCHCVSSALTSNPSHLRELDLSYNHPGDSGVKLLFEKLKDPNCKLDKLKYVKQEF